MKVIDLLNKIANEEIPSTKIMIKGVEYKFGLGSSIENYFVKVYEENEKWLFCEDIKLNDEVEIIEEDTFEDIEEMNLDVDCTCEYNFGECYDTINQLIRNQKKIISKLEDN